MGKIKKIIDKIFQDEGYKIELNSLLYNNEGKEYFIVDFFEEKEIFDFFQLKKTNDIILKIKELSKQSDYINIEKDTSVIILLKLNDIKNEYNDNLKNQIFRIEEDEYFFKKYVIIYTDKSLEKINIDDFNKDYIENILDKEGKFEHFFKDNLFEDEYFFAIQLFIKIPFLIYDGKAKVNLKNISDIISNNSQIDKKFIKIIEELKIDNTKDLDLEGEKLDEFLEKFNI